MIRAFLALTPFGGAFGVRSGILSVQSIPEYRFPDPLVWYAPGCYLGHVISHGHVN